MNNVNIIELLNLADGEVTFRKAGFVVSKRASAEVIRGAVIEALSDLDIYDEEQSREYDDVAVTSNYYTESQLDVVVEQIGDFGSLTQEPSKTAWFE